MHSQILTANQELRTSRRISVESIYASINSTPFNDAVIRDVSITGFSLILPDEVQYLIRAKRLPEIVTGKIFNSASGLHMNYSGQLKWVRLRETRLGIRQMCGISSDVSALFSTIPTEGT